MKRYLVIFAGLLLCSCANKNQVEVSETVTPTIQAEKAVYQDVSPIIEGDDYIIAFNTTISLETLTQEDGDILYPSFNDLMQHYGKLFDAHHAYTDAQGNQLVNVYYINNELKDGESITLDKDLFDLIQLSFKMSELTQDKFNPTLYDLSQLWAPLFSPFPMEQVDPDSDSIEQAKGCVILSDQLPLVFTLDEGSYTLTKNNSKCETGAKLDLGGIAKGYALDLVTKQLMDYQLPFLINSGTSSISAYTPQGVDKTWYIGVRDPFARVSLLYDVGLKESACFTTSGDDSRSISAYTPQGVDKTWYIGVRDPFARVSLLYDVGLKESACFTTSGDDSQYFLKTEGLNTIIRHHILDPLSGYSNNYIRSATVLSSPLSNGIADALSTALFNCETNDQRLAIVEAVKNEFNVQIEFATLENTSSDNGYLDITKGFKSLLIEGTESEHVIDTRVINE